MKTKTFVLTLAIWSIAVHSAIATVRTVSTVGQLRTAFRDMVPGDEVIINDGSYDLRTGTLTGNEEFGLLLKRNTNGTPSSWLNIHAANSNKRVFIYGSVRFEDCSYLILDGLTIQSNSNPPVYSSTQFRDRYGIDLYFCHHMHIRNNVCRFCGGGGIGMMWTDWSLIEHNYCYKNAKVNKYQHSGISIYQPINHGADTTGMFWGFQIRNNRSEANENLTPTDHGDITDGNGIITDDFYYTQNNSAFGLGYLGLKNYLGRIGRAGEIDNLIVPNASWASGYAPYGSTSTGGSHAVLIENNVCDKNGGRGIHNYFAHNVRIKNNTCFGNVRSNGLRDQAGEADLAVHGSTGMLIINNIAVSYSAFHSAGSVRDASFANGSVTSTANWVKNVFYNLSDSSMHAPTLGPPSNDNYAAFDPKFMNASTGNYSLRSISPAINFGFDLSEIGTPETDCAGLPRPSEPSSTGFSRSHLYDCGAYEFSGQYLADGEYRFRCKRDESGRPAYLHWRDNQHNAFVQTRSDNADNADWFNTNATWYVKQPLGTANNVYNFSIPSQPTISMFANRSQETRSRIGGSLYVERWVLDKVGKTANEFRIRNLRLGKYMNNDPTDPVSNPNNLNLCWPLDSTTSEWYTMIWIPISLDR